MACNSWWHIKRLSTPCSPDEHAKWSRNSLNAKLLVSVIQVSPAPVNSLRPTLQGPLQTPRTHALCHSQLANSIPFPSHLKCTGNFFWHWLRPHLGRWIYTSNHFAGGSDGKESAYNAGDPGSFPGSGRSPGEKTGNPLQNTCLENSMDRESWKATQSTRSQRVGHNWATFTFTERSEQTNMSKDKREFFFLSFTLIVKGKK